MPSTLRAVLAWSPAVIVLLGILLLSRNGETSKAEDDRNSSVDEPIIGLSTADQDRVHRIALKQETAIDMLDGRFTVEEATQRFLEISASDPECLDHLRRSARGATDDDKAFNQLMMFARIQARSDPQRFRAALDRAEQVAQSTQVNPLAHQ